jgi:membrane protease YdiL (CAAX protease family)
VNAAERSAPAAWWLLATLFVFACGVVASTAGIEIGERLVQPFGVADQVIWYAPGPLVFWLLGRWLVRRFDARGDAAVALVPPAAWRLLQGVLWYLPLGLLWWLCMAGYGVSLKALDVELPRQAAAAAFLDPRLDTARRLLMVASMVIAAPLGEEMLFRGLLHGSLRRWLRFWPAALLGGVLFGALHLEGRTWHTLLYVPPLALLGVMLAWLREKSVGLWGAVGLHAAHNAATLALLSSAG